jgi:hypothetical protein
MGEAVRWLWLKALGCLTNALMALCARRYNSYFPIIPTFNLCSHPLGEEYNNVFVKCGI